MNDIEAARYLGTEREALRRALLALKVPPEGHAYRRLRPYNLNAMAELERVSCDPIVYANGCARIFRDDRGSAARYHVLDLSGLQVAEFRRLRDARACADEWGCVADELFRRAAGGDEKAAAALAAIARRHVERAR